MHPSLQTNISIYHQTCKVSYVLAFLELFLIHFQKAIFTNFFEEFVNIKKYELYETVFQKYNQFFSKSRSVKLNYIIKKKKQSIFLPTLLHTHLRTHFFRSRINQIPFGVPAPRDRGEKRDYPIFKRRAPFVCPFALELRIDCSI